MKFDLIKYRLFDLGHTLNTLARKIILLDQKI